MGALPTYEVGGGREINYPRGDTFPQEGSIGSSDKKWEEWE